MRELTSRPSVPLRDTEVCSCVSRFTLAPDVCLYRRPHMIHVLVYVFTSNSLFVVSSFLLQCDCHGWSKRLPQERKQLLCRLSQTRSHFGLPVSCVAVGRSGGPGESIIISDSTKDVFFCTFLLFILFHHHHNNYMTSCFQNGALCLYQQQNKYGK